MSFDRTRLPDPITYYEGVGLKLTGRGKWRTTACNFHGGSDSMRVNLASGGFVCMAGCGAKGGDVLVYEMANTGAGFIDSAKALGAWIDDGRPPPTRPTPISPREALEVLSAEAMLVAIAAGNVAQGVVLSDSDRKRVMQSAGRINLIGGLFA